MARITTIRSKGRSTDRFVVEFEAAPPLTIGPDLHARFSLHEGDELDEATLEALTDESAALAAYDRAVRMLTVRGRSREDLRRRLVQKGCTPKHAAAAVERLAAHGYLDDAAFARQYARLKALANGRRRIAFELARQGVAPQVAAAALDEVLADPASGADDALERLVERRLRMLARLDPMVRNRRLQGFLERRGFSPGQIRTVLARLDDLAGARTSFD